MEHSEYCHKEGELATIKTELNDLKKIIKGNGQKGLQLNVIELNAVIPELKMSVDELSNNVRELLDRKIATDTERAVKMSARQKLAAIYGAIIGAATVIVMIADMIIKSRS